MAIHHVTLAAGGMKIVRFVRVDRFVRPATGGGRLALPTLHDVLWWLLALGIVVSAVQLAWIALTPVSPLGNWKPARLHLMDGGARSALMTGFDPFNRDPAVVAAAPGAAATVTDLPLTLFGIRVNAASGAGTAIIAGADGEQMVYRIGEEVQPGVTLSAVAFDHVTLARGGASELLYLDQSKPAPVVAPPANPVAPPPASDALSAASLRQGIAFPADAPDGGVILGTSGDGSVFRSAGLRPGDVLVGVNGRKIGTRADLSSFAGQVKPGQSLSLTVRRDEREIPVKITVSP